MWQLRLSAHPKQTLSVIIITHMVHGCERHPWLRGLCVEIYLSHPTTNAEIQHKSCCMNKVRQQRWRSVVAVWSKNSSECEKWNGKEEDVVVLRRDNYARMPGTWRWASSICAPSVPALHRHPLSQSRNQQQVLNTTLFFACFNPFDRSHLNLLVKLELTCKSCFSHQLSGFHCVMKISWQQFKMPLNRVISHSEYSILYPVVLT